MPWPSGPAGSALPGAIVHASLQERDFEPISPGAPLFETAEGELLVYDGSLGRVVHPCFVNEAAYYQAASGRGIVMCDRREWPVPAYAPVPEEGAYIEQAAADEHADGVDGAAAAAAAAVELGD